MAKHRRPNKHKFNPRAVGATFTAAIVLVALPFVTATATADSQLSPVEVAQAQKANCQLLASHASGTQKTRAQQCVTDQTAIINLLLLQTPSPSASQSSSSPSASTTPPTSSPPPTTTPTTSATPTTTPTSTAPPPPPEYPNATNRGATGPFTNDTRCTLAITNEVIVGKHFTCRLSVSATNVTIRNSQLDGGIDNWTPNGGHSFTLEDSTVGTSTCNGDFGVGATDYTARRVKVIGFTDGFRLSGRTSNPITIEDSYARTCHIVTAHTDGAQGDGNIAPVTIYHSTIDIRPSATDWTAAIFFPTDGALMADDNILAGGGYEFQIGGPGPFTITNNKLVDGSWQYAPSAVPCGSTTWISNIAVTLDANGQPNSIVSTVPCG